MYRGEISVAEIELMDLIDTAKGLTIHGLSEEDDVINKSLRFKIPQKKQLSKTVKRRKSPSKASPLGFSSAIHKFLKYTEIKKNRARQKCYLLYNLTQH